MAWGKAGSTTLTLSASTINLTVESNKFNNIITHIISDTGINPWIRMDNNAGNYSSRWSVDGAADGTLTNNTNGAFPLWGSEIPITHFGIIYALNISSEEKLIIAWATEGLTGASNAPSRREGVGKYAQTSAQVSSFDYHTSVAGNFLTDSNLTVLGSDMTPTAAIPFPTDVQVGSRAEITDTRKMYNLHDPSTNVLYVDATGQSNTSSHGTVVFIGDNATYATLFSRITATNTTHPHPAVNVDTPNKAFCSSDPWTIELTFKESYTIPSGSTITYNSYNNGQGARLKYLDFQVYTGSTWENITGTITNPNHSDGDVEPVSGRWVKYMTSTTTTEKTGTKFRVRMWDSWDNFVTNGRHYIGGIELKIPIGNVVWQDIGA